MTLSHIQADLLAKKALLESEIAEKQKELEQLTQQIKQLPKTIQEVVKILEPDWATDAYGNEITGFGFGRGYAYSPSAARQLQALNDLQNWCKALNEHFGSDGRAFFTGIDDGDYYFASIVDDVDQARLYALTPFQSKAAAEYAITCPDFCEALKILYTPVD